MKAYIVLEYNGLDYEDAELNPIAVYIDQNKAEQAVNEFNKSRKEPFKPKLSEKDFVPCEYIPSYQEYVDCEEQDWNYCEKRKKQSIEVFEITQ